MDQLFYDTMADSPIIAAVKDEAGMEACIRAEIKVVFVLFGDLCSITEIVSRLKEAGKLVLVHTDLIQGLSAKEVAVDFIKTQTKADGIITTRMNLINRAKQLSMYTVYRNFILDSRALESAKKQQTQIHADFMEILPGVMPKIIRELSKNSRIPVIAGGLIQDKEDVMEALEAGAISISTTNQDVWFM